MPFIGKEVTDFVRACEAINALLSADTRSRLRIETSSNTAPLSC